MPSYSDAQPLSTQQTILCLLFIIIASFFTYFWNYAYPPNVFWDENYHIASAQKYLHGVYFMEQHPPLGKLLVALGEKIIHPNARTDQFLGTDYGTNFPAGFSFAGYRFFSALLAWWTAPVLFILFLLLTRNALWGTFLSFLYVFDNALIVHMRGAMLEGPLLFFSALTIVGFLLVIRSLEKRSAIPTSPRLRGAGSDQRSATANWKLRAKSFTAATIFFGIFFALAMTTKVVSLVFILLVPVILYRIFIRNSQFAIRNWPLALRFLLIFVISFAVPYIAIWQTHFSLGSQINPSLPDLGYYQASAPYKKILKTHTNASLLSFPVMLRDSWKFVAHYNGGAPRLDLCKADENGSPFYFWPLGARSINYRWETPDGNSYRYLFLQANPVVWWTSFAAVLIAGSLLLCSVIAPPKNPLPHRFELTTFLGLYVAYMLAISRITRVMYLYHYFLPLLFSFVILALVFMDLRQIGRIVLLEASKTLCLMVLGGLIFLSFQFYRPLTYYLPIIDEQFQRRVIFSLWELHCVHCEKVSGLVVTR